jgi:hypothetical protein
LNFVIDPATVFVGRPIYHQTVPGHDRGMFEIIEDREIGAQYDHCNESSVSTARDYVVHYFLTRTTCEWLVWIDSDISFTRQDWRFLMEQHNNERTVCAEYLKKNQDMRLEVANFGLGFARVHRSVYEDLDRLSREDGEPRLLRYRAGVRSGDQQTIEEFVEYHPIGVLPDGSRRNEDHGFWLLVRLAGIPIRKETRTRLGHTGPFTWWYDAEKIERARRRRGAAQ